jgi:hypothetical protein
MLSATEDYAPGTEAAIRATIPPASLEAIDTTPGVAWLDFEHDHWLMDGTMQVLGQAGAIEAWHRAMGQLIKKPLLRNFAEAGLRLFLGQAGQIIQLLPKGWSLAYRDFCAPSYRRLAADRAEIRFEAIAPQVFQSEGYLHCWHAICLGVFDLERPREGRVQFEIDRPRALAVATFRWS